MSPENQNTTCLFGPFRLDKENERLWRKKQPIALKPKAFAVLCYLVARPGQLVTKEELLDALWSNTVVSEGILKFCIREIRTALQENAKAPQFIETVHRRGYRFVKPVRSARPIQLVQSPEPNGQRPDSPIPNPQPPTPALVGREEELSFLHKQLKQALRGQRQLIFVAGEAGIGKTALIETFNQQAQLTEELWVGHGQCVEQYGVGEAYLPVLEAFGRLCRQPDGQRLITLLHQHAPTWLEQMPALLSATEYAALQERGRGTTRERMLREMAEAVEAFTAERPLVLILEDLHWSDYSTLELLAALARRQEAARLFIIGTYRPVDAIVSEHPLRTVRQELQLHGQCQELLLEYLGEAAIRDYVATRCGHTSLPEGVATTIHQRTSGNPLFMVNVVDSLLRQGLLGEGQDSRTLKEVQEIIATSLPENLKLLIEQQLEQVQAEEREVLEAASVIGAEFGVASVAAGIEKPAELIEDICETLVRRRQFLHPSGLAEWPDGTVAARYRFIHTLYQKVLYDRVASGRRIRLHQRVGERLEAAYKGHTSEIAAALAAHFELGRDIKRAVQYHQQAGENALRRHGYQEAITHLTAALEFLETLPHTVASVQQELTLLVTLGPAVIESQGFASPEAGKVYRQAYELCQQLGETPQFFPVLWGLFSFYEVRAEYTTAHEMGQRLLSLAQSAQDSALLLEAHTALGPNLLWRGELAPAREHLEQGIALYDPAQHGSLAFLYGGTNPGIACRYLGAIVLWFLGYPEQARQRSQEAVSLAREVSSPFTLAIALDFAAWCHLLRREGHASQEQAEAAITLSTEQGFLMPLGIALSFRGGALAEQGQAKEAATQIREGLTSWRATGAELNQSFWLALLAKAYGTLGQIEAGLDALTEALDMVDKTGERFWEAELCRLKGELTLQESKVESHRPQVESHRPQVEEEAEASFHKAIDIAQHQQSKSLELRAATSLARLWQQHGKRVEARALLAPVYDWFTEGFDTADLKDAKALLEKLV